MTFKVNVMPPEVVSMGTLLAAGYLPTLVGGLL